MPIIDPSEKAGGAAEKGSNTEILPSAASPAKNPRRVAAGRMNHAKRRGFTEAGLERLRQAALLTRPWEYTRGPATPEGKLRSSQNGRSKTKAVREYVQLREEIRSLMAPAMTMRRAYLDLLAGQR